MALQFFTILLVVVAVLASLAYEAKLALNYFAVSPLKNPWWDLVWEYV